MRRSAQEIITLIKAKGGLLYPQPDGSIYYRNVPKEYETELRERSFDILAILREHAPWKPLNVVAIAECILKINKAEDLFAYANERLKNNKDEEPDALFAYADERIRERELNHG